MFRTFVSVLQVMTTEGQNVFFKDVVDFWNPKTIVFFPRGQDVESVPHEVFQRPPLEPGTVFIEQMWTKPCLEPGLYIGTFEPIHLRHYLRRGCSSKVLFLLPFDSYHLQELYPRLDSQLFLYNGDRSGRSMSLYEFYSTNHGRPTINHIGNWSHDTGFEIPQPMVWERRNDLSGIHFRTVVMESPPIIAYKHHATNGELVNVTGYFLDILEAIQERLGFTFDVRVSFDGQWGGKDEDGNWNGMIGMLMKNETDICISSLSITGERNKVIDYATTIVQDVLTLITVKESTNSLNVWVYLEVFHRSVWIFIIILFTALSCSFFFIKILGLESLHKDPEGFSFLNGLALVTLILVQRDYPLNTDRITTRILFYVTCTCSFLLFAYYTADLTSSMTVKPQATSIESFRDIIDTDYQLVSLGDSSWEDALSMSKPGSPLKILYEKTMKNNPKAFTGYLQTLEIEELILKDPKLLYFANALPFQTSPHFKVQPLSLVDQINDPQGFGMQKETEFLDMFNFHLRQLKESGMFFKMKNKWLPSNRIYSLPQAEKIVLGYENLIFPFLILVVGVLGAVLLLAMEHAFRLIIKIFFPDTELVFKASAKKNRH